MAKIRSPICSVMGHVDHGKTSILDKVRNTAIVKTEAGAITQAIGASIIPLDVIKKVAGGLLSAMNIKFTIPGLLFIDTPGHAAFSALRKRGGNLADIAILVIDINEGLKPQTEESIEILKSYKTPFIIAANKIDLVSGWQKKEKNLIANIESQAPDTTAGFETKLYGLVGRMHEFGFEADRFDRVKNYTKQIAIVPVSAKTGEGIPELLMVLTGLAQRYFEDKLKIEAEGFAKGTVLEVKEEKGLGMTLDVIICDGSLKKGDIIIIGGLEKPIVTKVKALFEPMPLAEMRNKKSKFKPMKEVTAATGVKISAPDIKDVVAGMPLRSCSEKDIEKVEKEIQKEVQEVIVEKGNKGIIVKADSLGSLEAVAKLLEEKQIKIKKASIGNISKKDISDAEANYEKDPLQAVILGFNVSSDIKPPDKIKIITNDVIYKLIEDFEKWQEEKTHAEEAEKLDILTRPCKVKMMPGYIFRQNNPAVFGVSVLSGVIKTKTPLMKEDGKHVGDVKSIQAEQENVEKAEAGKQVAISVPKVTVGRQINEGDILLSDIPEDDFRKFKKLKKYLSKAEIELLKEIAKIKREENPVWGI
ncbi:translation initiation factor IF-2 [Candidatus Woesearchaeota archaeon]|nr:translation initiation factor IF-2 [Candidatus Woesearchaeota archaeon]